MISKPSTLSGILVALITPFTDDSKAIDKERLKNHIDRVINAGCHGLVPGGSTGEFTAMTINERKQLCELAVEYAAGRVPVVVGIGSTSTQECLELAQHAANSGASALMVVPPFYDPLSYQQLKELLSEIHDVSQLPIVYYHIPSASGTNLTPVQIAGLSECGVKYMKDTSGNAPNFVELIFNLHDKITAFNGWDSLTFFGLCAGSKGSVWGASNIIPELSAELWDAIAVKSDLKKGRELWSKIYPICKFLEEHNYASAVKTGMELLGYQTGGTRKPFSLLAAEPRNELAGILRAAGLKVIE